MNWDDVRIFLAVARAGQILGAARRLELNHATVSRRIAALEDALRTKLFRRLTTGSELTPAGERFLDIAERMELPEAASGQQLERTVELLVDRLLANPARRGRALRRLRLAAGLAGGGGWRVEVAMRQASSDRERLCLVLVPRYGGHGAAAATSISLVFETVLLFWIVRQRLGLHVLAFGKRS